MIQPAELLQMMAWQAANLLDAPDALVDPILHQYTSSMLSSFIKLSGVPLALEAYPKMLVVEKVYLP